jgi:hypothetical protein
MRNIFVERNLLVVSRWFALPTPVVLRAHALWSIILQLGTTHAKRQDV